MRDSAIAGTTTEAVMSSSSDNFSGGMKIFAQAERAPRAIFLKSDAQIIGNQFAIVAFQFVAGRAVDDIHAEMFAPIVAPFGLVKALHHEDEFLDVLRNVFEPGVVFRGVFAREA